jgi:hypothetical protein
MGDGCSIQVEFLAPDNHLSGAPGMEVQKGRKWYVSKYSTPAEVVQTCFKAVITALEHEAREQFKYKGVAVLQPHMDLDMLVQQAQQKVMRDPFPKAGPPTHVLDVGDLRHVNAID